MDINQTLGVNKENFVPVDTKKEIITTNGLEDKTNLIIKGIPEAIKSLEDRSSFLFLLVSIIGYILISSSGNMTSSKNYFFYISFLLFVYFFYILSKNKFDFLKLFIIFLFFLIVSFFVSKFF